MQLTVTAPADWKISTQDKVQDEKGAYWGTLYTARKGGMKLLVDKTEKTTETARATVDRWKYEHETKSPPTGGSAAIATVESTTHQGRDAAVITETYSQSLNGNQGTERRLNKVLVVTNSRQERFTLGVNIPDGKTAAKTADDLLRKAQSAYRIGNL